MTAERGGRRAECTSGRASHHQGYLMAEALVYIAVVFVVLGVGYAALYRCIDNSMVMRRNANDITKAMHAGERWRADVRAAGARVYAEMVEGEPTLHLSGAQVAVDYAFRHGTVIRRAGAGPWVIVLERVKASSMQADPRGSVRAWRWELELQPQTKAAIRAGRVRPLFSFITVPRAASAP
jgi:hypothetical protein